MSSYKVEYKNTGNPVDISSYITNIGDIPYIVRNPDYTIVADSCDFRLSGAYLSSSNLVEGTHIYIYSGSKLILNGRVSEKLYDYEKREYKVTVSNALLDLTANLNHKARMNSFIAPLCEINLPVHNYLYSDIIRHNNLITAHFSASGFKLDWDTYYVPQTRSMAIAATIDLEQTALYTTFRDTTEDDIYYNTDAMYCINQAKVWSPQWLGYNDGDTGSTAPNTAEAANMLSSFDIVNILSSMTGYNYIPKDTGSYYVVSSVLFSNPNPIISYDDYYEYEEKLYKPKTGCKVNYTTLALDLSTYFNFGRWYPWGYQQAFYHFFDYEYNKRVQLEGRDDNLGQNSYATGSNPTSLKWYNHLVPLYIETKIYEFLGFVAFLFPDVRTDDTIIQYQRQNAVYGGTEKKLLTKSSNVWNQASLGTFQSIMFKDLKEDSVELKWRVVKTS